VRGVEVVHGVGENVPGVRGGDIGEKIVGITEDRGEPGGGEEGVQEDVWLHRHA